MKRNLLKMDILREPPNLTSIKWLYKMRGLPNTNYFCAYFCLSLFLMCVSLVLMTIACGYINLSPVYFKMAIRKP